MYYRKWVFVSFFFTNLLVLNPPPHKKKKIYIYFVDRMWETVTKTQNVCVNVIFLMYVPDKMSDWVQKQRGQNIKPISFAHEY